MSEISCKQNIIKNMHMLFAYILATEDIEIRTSPLFLVKQGTHS